ncbi:MAG: hypothetical protein JWR72_1609 [Flavisolibacter sp.]|nr:hypothetical protein [Flavisolibacter sp.]
MNLEISSLLSSCVTLLAAFIYFLTYRFQNRKIELLQSSIDSQSKIITDFEKYKSLFDISDFEKRLELKLDNQKMELGKSFQIQNQKSIEAALEKYSEHVFRSSQEALGGWEELINIANSITLLKYPDKNKKAERDAFILKNYPKNADFMIRFLDDSFDGKIHPNGQKK